MLGENETALSKALRSKWRVLEEIDAYATYQKAPAVSGEKQILIDTTLDQMRTILFEAMGGVRQSDEEQSGSKLVSGILLQRN